MTVNCVSAIEMCRLVVPAMAAIRRGRLVLITSQAAITGGTDAAYAASKAGLVAFGKSIAREYGPEGLRITMVSPGPVDTGMASVMPPERRAHYESTIPIRRFTWATEVADLVEYVLLRAPDALHGSTVEIDGGLVRR